MFFVNRERSRQQFKAAKKVIPGGVNSPVRAYGSVGGEPPFIAKGRGVHVWDIDGRKYLDFMGSWGPLILGHAHPRVIRAVKAAAARGTSFGAPTVGETELAQRVVNAYPSMDQVRLVNSGTEAAMSAARLARAITGRANILKFEGGYHGHADSFLVRAGSAVATLGLPDSPGVPAALARQTLTLPYNDISALKKLFRKKGKTLAGVFVEPVAGNMGVVAPASGFLSELRRLTRKSKTLLIFDEVITGFRVGPQGAQGLYGVVPDLTLLGKILGGGFPLAAYGGRRKYMAHIAPQGPVYQAGTLSGNPVAVAAGLETLKVLQKPGTYKRLDRLASDLANGLRKAGQKAGISIEVNQVGSMLTPFFSSSPVENMTDAKKADLRLFRSFFWGLQKCGIMVPPSPYESWFVSTAHSQVHIRQAVRAAEKVLGFIGLGKNLGKTRRKK